MGIAVRAAQAAMATSAVLTLGGCGSGSPSAVAEDPASTPTSTPVTSPSTGGTDSPTVDPPHVGPACAAVWRDGARLAQGYHGCLGSSGWVKAQAYQCSDGHHVVTYAHTFYAQPGRSITKSSTTLVHDQAFQHLMARCGA